MLIANYRDKDYIDSIASEVALSVKGRVVSAEGEGEVEEAHEGK